MILQRHARNEMMQRAGSHRSSSAAATAAGFRGTFFTDFGHTFLFSSLLLLILLLSPIACQAQTSSSIDVTGLQNLMSQVGGSSPNMTSWNSNTSSNSSPCNWTGVTCDPFSGRVIKLNLSNFQLKGTLNSDIFPSLTALTSLDLSYNSLASPLPSFNVLSQLNDLNLSMNNFSESFPQSITQSTTLVELRMDSNRFVGSVPDEISNLQKLEQLWLGNNSFSGPFPTSLSTLTHMKILTGWGNNLNMELPGKWSVWQNITYLNFHDSYLTGPLPAEWGPSFTKLERLYLYNNKLSGNLPDSWKGMTSLATLRLYQNDLTGSIPESWKAMTSLAELRMDDNELSGSVPSWISQINPNNRVDFKCNYLQGPVPTFFNDSTWKGNCFDSNTHLHEQSCGSDEPSCKDFFSGRKSSSKTPIIVGIVIGLCVLLSGIAALTFWLRYFRDKHDTDLDDWEVPAGVRRFTLKEIMKATKSFGKTCEIGEGGFGKVYLGQLEDKRYVAIKRASKLSLQGTKEFRNEISLLSRLHHRHLVRLEGFCVHKKEQILVYEYMGNGNLHRHLFSKEASALNWYRRLEIALAVAQGLDYLHSFADPPVIHRDVKPSNILLDDNMVAKVSDFGISKANSEMDTHVSTRPAGTAGYLDPEYFLRRQLTTASDVYGYGVVLLELLTGQLAIDHTRIEDYNLVSWVRTKVKRSNIEEIIDERLGTDYPVQAYRQVTELAIQCTEYERGQRPKMQAVAASLELILSQQTPPPEHMMDFVNAKLEIKGGNNRALFHNIISRWGSFLNGHSSLPLCCDVILCFAAAFGLKLPHPSMAIVAQIVRMMGSGPRTHPGGISDKEWRKMQRRQIRLIEKEFHQQRRAEALERRAYLASLTRRLNKEECDMIQNPEQQPFITPDGRPSQRFFPPNAVYSTRLLCKMDASFASDGE